VRSLFQAAKKKVYPFLTTFISLILPASKKNSLCFNFPTDSAVLEKCFTTVCNLSMLCWISYFALFYMK
jgi:hypothetical protein